MRKDFFIFGGVNSLDYGVLLDGSGTTTAPERDVMTVTIPGRSGDLLVDAGRWKNTTVSYPCTIAREFEGRFAAFKQALLAEGGYKRLEDTLHPDEYRLAYLAGPLEPDWTATFLSARSSTLLMSSLPASTRMACCV